MKELVTKIADFRREYDMTQGDLASRVGVRRETIIRLEKGQYNPSLKLAADIAEVFGVQIEEVFQFVVVEDEATRRANMVYFDATNSEELEILIKGLIRQTKFGKIEWECNDYNPISILYDDGIYDDKKPEAVISQAFDGEAVVGGRPVFVSITDSITVDNEKGNLAGEISLDVNDGTTRQEFSLTYAELYDQLDANGVARQYRNHLVAELFDTLVPIFAKSEATAFGFSFARFCMIDLPAKYKRKPIVKLCKKLLEEGRAEDFHKIVLNMQARETLLTEV